MTRQDKIGDAPDKKAMISVIIPAYNAERTLPHTLRALQNQTLPGEQYEVIVVDDASTDKTGSVAREFGVRYQLQNKEGPAAARNLGVRLAQGEIILFTDSDCIPEEDWIEKMIEPFSDPQVAGVMGRYLTRQREFFARFTQLEFEERFSILGKHETIDLVPSFAAAFRRSVFEEVGGFNQHYPLANNEDVELSYKIAERGYKMVFRNDAVIYHQHPANWRKYFRIKYSRAFWRTLVYKKFPGKMIKDAYTPQSLKAQILSAGLLAISPLALILGLSLGLYTIAAAALLFLLTCLPFMLRTLRFDPQMALAAPLVLFPKSLLFGAGVFMGMITGGDRDSVFPIVLAVSDGLMAIVSLGLGFWVRAKLFGPYTIFGKQMDYFSTLLLVFPILIVLVFQQFGLYRIKTCISKLTETILYFKAFAVVALLIMAGMFLLKLNYSQTLLVVVFTTAFFLIGLARFLLKGIHDRMLSRGVNATRVLIVGAGETAQMLLEKTHSFPTLGYYVVGFVAETGLGRSYLGKRILGTSKELLRIVEEHQVDEVIFARPNMKREKVLNLIVQLEKADVDVKMVSDLYDIVTSSTVIDGIADVPMIEIYKRRFRPVQDFFKGCLDYTLGTFTLFFALPFWLLVSLLIRLDSSGPVLIRSERIGKKGKPFILYRFRTLYANVPQSAKEPADWNDPRVTRVGKFLRRTSLDESPQLLNVLRGEMSLVGPRPELPRIVAAYSEWQKLRLEAKPGITGLWQIMGRKDLFLHENLEYDFYYIKNRSLLLDLTILLRTGLQLILGAARVQRSKLVNLELERRDFNNLGFRSESEEIFKKSAHA